MSLEARIQELEQDNDRLRRERIAFLERQNQGLRTQERIRELEKQNARLRAPARVIPLHPTLPQSGARPRHKPLLRSPRFRAFCRRRIDGKTPSLEEILAKQKKARKAAFVAFCRRRGVNSILKDGAFTTGALLRYGDPPKEEGGKIDWYCESAQTAKFKKIDGEWVSVVEGEIPEGTIVENVHQFAEE